MADLSRCPKCGGQMRPGVAIAQTLVGAVPDFPGGEHPITLSAGGPGTLTGCMKCDGQKRGEI